MKRLMAVFAVLLLVTGCGPAPIATPIATDYVRSLFAPGEVTALMKRAIIGGGVCDGIKRVRVDTLDDQWWPERYEGNGTWSVAFNVTTDTFSLMDDRTAREPAKSGRDMYAFRVYERTQTVQQTKGLGCL